jgi:hypothetical protein
MRMSGGLFPHQFCRASMYREEKLWMATSFRSKLFRWIRGRDVPTHLTAPSPRFPVKVL